jgi:hypothetical protein
MNRVMNDVFHLRSRVVTPNICTGGGELARLRAEVDRLQQAAVAPTGELPAPSCLCYV